MCQKKFFRLFFILMGLYSSMQAMKRTHNELSVSLRFSGSEKCHVRLEAEFAANRKPVMAITQLSEEELDSLEPKLKKHKQELIVRKESCSKSFPCSMPGCFYVAIKENAIKRHQELHLLQQTKPAAHIYFCNECSFLSTGRGVFARHMKSHSILKNYICKYCNKSLKYKDSLQRHIRYFHA